MQEDEEGSAASRLPGSRASLVLTEEDAALLAMDSPLAANMTPRAFHAARYRIRKKMMAHRSEQRAAAGLAAKGGADKDARKKTLATLGLQPIAMPLAMGLCKKIDRELPESALAILSM